MENEETMFTEVEWSAPDGSVSVSIVSQGERYGIALTAGDNHSFVAEFSPNVTFEVLVSIVVLLQISGDPKISDRFHKMLQQEDEFADTTSLIVGGQ